MGFGALLVGAVLSDVFRSVVVPGATRRSLRVGPLLSDRMLPLWLFLGRRRSKGRHAQLSALGPLLLVLELLIWVLLLVLGYGLMVHASGGLKPHGGFGDSVFAAASAFFTTGLSGQQEAVSGFARFLIAVAGFSGLAVVTLVVTFLLSVQSALHRREALVVRLRERTGPHPSGVAILLRHSRLGREHDQALLEFFRDWDMWAADVLLTHRAYPILSYFRSTDEDCEWLAALTAVLDAAALVAATRHEGDAEHALLCHRMGARLARDLARQFRLPVKGEIDLDRGAFEKAMQRLEKAGFSTEDEQAWTRFAELYRSHAPALRALTGRFGVEAAAW